MEGGEGMHFRQLIKAVLIGTALFFPAHAFAEKPDTVHVKKENTFLVVHSSEHSSAFKKMDQHRKVTGKVQGHAVKYSRPDKALAVQRLKQHPKLATLATKNRKHVAANKGKRTAAATKKVNLAFSLDKRNQKKQLIQARKKSAVSPAPIYKKFLSKQEGSGAGENNKVHFSIDTNGKTSGSAQHRIHAALATPVSNKNGQDPFKNGLPGPLQVLNFQSNTTLGQVSVDQGKTGKGNTCLPALLLNQGYDPLLSINRTYVSRSVDILNQWTNAPPFHPPIDSLFF